MSYYKDINVTSMYNYDVSECGRPPNYWSSTALEWYCIYATENGIAGLGDCTGFAKCKFAGDCVPVNATVAAAARTAPTASAT